MAGKSELTKKYNKIKSNLNDSNSTLSAFKEIAGELQSALADLEQEDANILFLKKNSNKNFNNIIQICLQDVPPALIKVFNVEGSKVKNAKKFKRNEEAIHSYLADIILLSKAIMDPVARLSITKMGILPLVAFFNANKKISRELIKQMVTFWSTGEHNLRVVSFVIIFKICQSLTDEAQERTIKSMYEAYIRNCKFNSPSQLALINFMRASLCEMYMVNEGIAYKHAFVYTRQMAIHLRNASTNKTEQTLKIVYNWQFVHALHLWSDVLSKSHPSEYLEPLIYPVIQISIALMSVKKSTMFYPLVLAVCKILTMFSRETKVFIPVLPHLLELVGGNFPNKKSNYEEPINWDCVLSLSKSQLDSGNFVTGFITLVLDAIKDYLSMESASVGFPEMAYVASLKLRAVMKVQSGELKMNIKNLVEAIESNSTFIEQRRTNIKCSFSDMDAMRLWEIETAQIGTPLSETKTSTKKNTKKQNKRKLEPVSYTDEDVSEEQEEVSARKYRHEDLFETVMSNQDEYDSVDDSDYLQPKEPLDLGDDETSSEADYSDYEENDATHLSKETLTTSEEMSDSGNIEFDIDDFAECKQIANMGNGENADKCEMNEEIHVDEEDPEEFEDLKNEVPDVQSQRGWVVTGLDNDSTSYDVYDCNLAELENENINYLDFVEIVDDYLSKLPTGDEEDCEEAESNGDDVQNEEMDSTSFEDSNVTLNDEIDVANSEDVDEAENEEFDGNDSDEVDEADNEEADDAGNEEADETHSDEIDIENEDIDDINYEEVGDSENEEVDEINSEENDDADNEEIDENTFEEVDATGSEEMDQINSEEDGDSENEEIDESKPMEAFMEVDAIESEDIDEISSEEDGDAENEEIDEDKSEEVDEINFEEDGVAENEEIDDTKSEEVDATFSEEIDDTSGEVDTTNESEPVYESSNEKDVTTSSDGTQYNEAKCETRNTDTIFTYNTGILDIKTDITGCSVDALASWRKHIKETELQELSIYTKDNEGTDEPEDNNENCSD